MNLRIDYKSRIKRLGFWRELTDLIFWTLKVALPFVILFFFFTPTIEQVKITLLVFGFVLIWPISALYVRRLHDIGLPGWVFAIVFLPVIYFRALDVFAILTIILGLIDSSHWGDKYEEKSADQEDDKPRVETPTTLFTTALIMGLIGLLVMVFVFGSSINPDAEALSLSRIIH